MREQHQSTSASGVAVATSPKPRNRLVQFGLIGLLLVAIGYSINTVLNAPSDQNGAAGTTSPVGITLPTFTPSLSSTSMPRPTVTPTPPPLAVVQIDTLNVREGPGTQYEPPLTQVSTGDELTVLGRARDVEWIKVRLPDATEGWVSAESGNVRLNVDLEQLPIAYFRPPTGIVEGAARLVGNGSLDMKNDGSIDSAVIVGQGKNTVVAA